VEKMNIVTQIERFFNAVILEEPIGDEESQRFDSPNERFFAFAQNDKERTSPILIIKKSLNLDVI
jgi:hypothetical protein